MHFLWLGGVIVSLATPAAATTLTRGPYLQLVTTRSATVVWNTDRRAPCALAIRQEDGPSTIVEGETDTVCVITVEGLSPGTAYAYAPLADGEALEDESIFRTDDPARPFTFLLFGDSGEGGAGQGAVAEAMEDSPADFIVHTGDMVYETGAAEDYDPKFFRHYEELLAKLVLWPCLGNHDVLTDGGGPWRDAFHTPANNAAGTEHYYSFDYGNAHVVVLDSNDELRPGSPQYEFLDQDLGASEATWKFVAFHHSIYTSGGGGSDTLLRAQLASLFDRHRVDVVFMGHRHVYERTKPLARGRVVPNGEGTVYVTTGGGGGSLGTPGLASYTAYTEAAYHFVRVAVDGATLQLEMVRADGVVRDAAKLIKSQINLAPVADTYVRAGAQATWDHGTADQLAVDADLPAMTYLKFDLRGVTSAIRAATLTLHCTNSSSDGGTVYPVADSRWVEGVRRGEDSSSANGPGLKWTDVYPIVNGSSAPGDPSPYVPDFTRAVTNLGAVRTGMTYASDVTAVFQGGPGVYTLAIRSTSADQAAFASRQSGELGPMLHLEVAPGPPCTTGADCDDGDPCNGVERCEGRCQPGVPIDCDDGQSCASTCDDGNVCTSESCGPDLGCLYVPNTVACDDRNPCTEADICRAGQCVGEDTGVCRLPGRCREADGQVCDDGNPCSTGDVCSAGTCQGVIADRDGDGACDWADRCPDFADPDQRGICACSAPAPGRCIPGGGSEFTDCFLELNPSGPVTLTADGSRVRPIVRCVDGDPACDRDHRAGRCTFGLAVCLGNADPRFPGCAPAGMQSLEVFGSELRGLAGENIRALEQAAALLGLEVRRRGRVISPAVATGTEPRCTPPASLVVPASRTRGGKPVRRTLRLRATTSDGRHDRDRITLECQG